ncbi:hypothetical protein JCM8097_008870 [Rhodosporidiobolus ruineniae]
MRAFTLAALSALSAVALSAPASTSTFAELTPTAPAGEGLEADLLKTYHPKILIMRHGEKKNDGSVGLNEIGKKRAQCLRKVLGRKGKHHVGLILAEAYNPDTRKRIRPYLTVKPLADDLDLTVDTECEVDDAKCVRKKVAKYVKNGGKGEVVICWKHSMLNVIAHELGAPKTDPYPDDRFDIIWTIHRNRIITKESEQCPGIDKPAKKGKKDPDLEIPGHLNEGDDEDGEWEEGDGEEEEEEEYPEWPEYESVPGSRGQLRLADLD